MHLSFTTLFARRKSTSRPSAPRPQDNQPVIDAILPVIGMYGILYGIDGIDIDTRWFRHEETH